MLWLRVHGDVIHIVIRIINSCVAKHQPSPLIDISYDINNDKSTRFDVHHDSILWHVLLTVISFATWVFTSHYLMEFLYLLYSQVLSAIMSLTGGNEPRLQHVSQFVIGFFFNLFFPIVELWNMVCPLLCLMILFSMSLTHRTQTGF